MKNFLVITLALIASTVNAQGIDRLIDVSCGTASEQYSKAFGVLDEMLREKIARSLPRDELLKEMHRLAGYLDTTTDDNHIFYKQKIENSTSDEGRTVYRVGAAASAYVGSIAKELWFNNLLTNKQRYLRVIDEECRSELLSRLSSGSNKNIDRASSNEKRSQQIIIQQQSPMMMPNPAACIQDGGSTFCPNYRR